MMQKRSIKDARGDFPMMDRQVHGDKRLVYLDNASTTQKPLQVIDTLTKYYKNYNANFFSCPISTVQASCDLRMQRNHVHTFTLM